VSLYRRAAKRDDNEPECAAAARGLGASWEPVSGKGIPDGLVGFRGETLLMEVKRKGGTLTPAQVEFRKRWRGSPPITVTTADDVRRALLGYRVTLSRVLASEQAASEAKPAHGLVDEVGAYPTEGKAEPQRCRYGALVCTHSQCHGKRAA
jgi:hypothetical protein